MVIDGLFAKIKFGGHRLLFANQTSDNFRFQCSCDPVLGFLDLCRDMSVQPTTTNGNRFLGQWGDIPGIDLHSDVYIIYSDILYIIYIYIYYIYIYIVIYIYMYIFILYIVIYSVFDCICIYLYVYIMYIYNTCVLPRKKRYDSQTLTWGFQARLCQTIPNMGWSRTQPLGGSTSRADVLQTTDRSNRLEAVFGISKRL